MKILITNLFMDEYNGTTLYVKELALFLKEKGEAVQVYTRVLGPIGLELKEKGIQVTTNLKNLGFYPDIIHAHHNVTTIEVLSFFKKTPALFWIHDRLSPYDHPPYHKNILKYLAVDYNCKERYTKDLNFDPSDVEVIYNWVNLERFKLKKSINIHPKNALVFSNYASDHNFLTEIKKACLQCRLNLDIIGKESGNPIIDPENHLVKYDIIFAKAKAAMEAICVGAGVIICDFKGLAGMVTTDNLNHYRKFNFGMKLMTHPAQKKLIIEEIKKFDAKNVEEVSRILRSEIDIHKVIDQLLHIYKESIVKYKKGETGKHSFKISNFIHIKSIKYYFIMSRFLKNNFHGLFVKLRGWKRKI